jgi:signal transduction histidine kinase
LAHLPVVSRRGAAPPRDSHALALAKVGLLELLTASEDLPELAARSLEWLAEFAGLQQGVLLGLDLERDRLVAIASRGLSDGALDEFSLDLGDRKNPLVAAALSRGTATSFTAESAGLRLTRGPLKGRPFLAVPLYGSMGKEEWSAGLLLAAPTGPTLDREARWLGGVLGHRLLRLTRIQYLTEAERRVRRDRMLLDRVQDPIVLTDPEGRMLVANARAQALLGSVDEGSEGRRRAVALNNMLFSAALAQGTLRDPGRGQELLLVDPVDGSDLLFEMMSTLVSDPREGTAVVSILRNVSDLRRAMEEIEDNYRRLRMAETEVRSERDRLNVIIDSVADPILVTDSMGELMLMNAPAERLFTTPRDAPPEHALRVRANDAHFSSFVSNVFLARTDRHRGEIGLVDPATGAPLPVEAVTGKILSEHGEVVTFVTVLHDLTEQAERARLYEELKKASEQLEQRVREATSELVTQNERLRRQQLELEQASAAKSQFLANMSHEFRTPLNAILGYTSLLLKEISGPLNPQQEKNLGRVDSNARHLLALINDILDISRIEAGRMPVTLSTVEVPSLINEVLAELDPLITASKLAVRHQSERDVPPLETDRAKVKQILLNLVSNAVKFTPSGSITVSAGFDRRRRQMRIAVTDTGIGIAPQEQERIFEDFRQADSSMARKYGGAGLGLSISRRLAVMLQGTLELSSSAGQGSTFTLVLPRSPKAR